jgi:hypothetical protein
MLPPARGLVHECIQEQIPDTLRPLELLREQALRRYGVGERLRATSHLRAGTHARMGHDGVS